MQNFCVLARVVTRPRKRAGVHATHQRHPTPTACYPHLDGYPQSAPLAPLKNSPPLALTDIRASPTTSKKAFGTLAQVAILVSAHLGRYPKQSAGQLVWLGSDIESVCDGVDHLAVEAVEPRYYNDTANTARQSAMDRQAANGLGEYHSEATLASRPG